MCFRDIIGCFVSGRWYLTLVPVANHMGGIQYIISLHFNYNRLFHWCFMVSEALSLLISLSRKVNVIVTMI